MRLTSAAITIAMVLAGGSPGVSAQSTDTSVLVHRLATLEDVVRALEKEVSELNSLLRASLPPPPISVVAPVDVNITNAAVRGSASTKVVLIEFSDFECPFCGQHAQTTYGEIQRQFVETGQVKYVVRNLPLENLHAHALKAAEAAECAREQGRYWEMHDRLFANQKALALTDLLSHADGVSLDHDKFQSCLADGKMTAKVRDDVAEARRLGLTGTPAFLLGVVMSDGRVRVTQKIDGAQPFAVFQAALQTILAKPESVTK